MTSDDGKKTTPPQINSGVLRDVKTLLEVMTSRQKKTPSPDRPRYVFVVQSHGSSIQKQFEVEVPIVATVKDGERHTRSVLNEDDTRVNPPIVDSLAMSMKKVQQDGRLQDLGYGGLLENVFQATLQLAIDRVTKSNPEKYEIRKHMEDIQLFCGGKSLYDSIFKINIDKLSKIDVSAGGDVNAIRASLAQAIQPASASFGLNARYEERRNWIGTKKPTPMNQKLKGPFWTEHDNLQKNISDLTLEVDNFKKFYKGKELPVDKLRELRHKFTLYERAVHWYNNSRSSRKGISKEPRLHYHDTCISLSRLINIGIKNGIIVPEKDCVFVSTCRSHHDDRPSSSHRPHPPLPHPPPPPRTLSSSDRPSKRDPSPLPPHQLSKRPRPEDGGTRKRSRKLNKKTRRVKMRRNKTKSRTRKY
jgi:hypothetical protein